MAESPRSLFCPLHITAADPDRVHAFLARGLLPAAKVRAVQELLRWQGDTTREGIDNAICLLLIPYDFLPIAAVADDTRRAILARACDVRADDLLTRGPVEEATTGVCEALRVLREAARELVADYDYHIIQTPLGQYMASRLLRTCADPALFAHMKTHFEQRRQMATTMSS